MGRHFKNIRAGDVFKTNEGGSVTVVEYRDSRSVMVEHNDKFKHRSLVPSTQLRGGSVKNPYNAKIYGAGYVGVGSYKTSENKKDTPEYKLWCAMLRRGYSGEYHAKHPSYVGVTVCEEWLNFQTFAKWVSEQPNRCKPNFELDKDLRSNGSREYSPSTCSFVPGAINRLIGKQRTGSSGLPQGVSYNQGKFEARLVVDGVRLNLGAFQSPELAFNAYKLAKEKRVASAAEQWRDQLHVDVYKYLTKWTLS